MSQPKRFRGGPHWEDSNGEWIKHADYAALAADNERLRKMLEMYLKADPLIGEAVASAMLASKEGKSV